MSYSVDLREKAVALVESGQTQKSVAPLLNIGLKTLQRWMKLKRKTGNLAPKPHGGGRRYKADLAALEAYVIEHPDKTLVELGEIFGAGKSSIHRALKKLNFVSKKNAALQGKGRRKTKTIQ